MSENTEAGLAPEDASTEELSRVIRGVSTANYNKEAALVVLHRRVVHGEANEDFRLWSGFITEYDWREGLCLGPQLLDAVQTDFKRHLNELRTEAL